MSTISSPEIPIVASPTDEEAMRRLRANDISGLDVLFRRYSRFVLGIAARTLHDYGEAEEVVQDTFFSVFQKAKLFEPSKGTVKAWIAKIAFHRALDRRAYLDRRGLYLNSQICPLDETLLGKTDLDQEINITLSRQLLQRAFRELPEVQRRTIELFYFEGMELREISEILNETWENVRHHFYRGIEHLRKSAFIEMLREK